jgi:hypothetical protein
MYQKEKKEELRKMLVDLEGLPKGNGQEPKAKC